MGLAAWTGRPVDRVSAALEQGCYGVGGKQAGGRRVFGGQPGRDREAGDGELRGVPGGTEFFVFVGEILRQQSIVMLQPGHVEVIVVVQGIAGTPEKIFLVDINVVVGRSAFALQETNGAEIHAGAGGL